MHWVLWFEINYAFQPMNFTVLVICPQIIAIEMAFIPCVHLYVNGYSIPEYFVSNLYDLLLIRTTQVQHRLILSDVPAVTNNNLPWKVQWQKSTNLDSCSQRQDGFPHTLLSHTYIHACMQARTHIHQSIHPSTHTYIHTYIVVLTFCHIVIPAKNGILYARPERG